MRYNFDYLLPYNKIIVTGPPRSGTTFGARVIAKELNYKFIDESWYDGNDVKKFYGLLSLSRKMVIQMTAFVRDLHLLDRADKAIVIMRRSADDIEKSMEHSESFNVQQGDNIFTKFDDKAKEEVLKHYGRKEGSIPVIIYNHIYDTLKGNYHLLSYESLKFHPLWIKKEDRRKSFTHLKQIDFNPNYIKEKTGFMICQT